MSKKRRKLSSNRYDDDYKSRNKGGSSRKGVVDWKKAAGEADVKFFNPRTGTNKFNIIPYEVKSKLHPLVREGKMEIGDIDYVLDVWAHRYVGPDKNIDILCPKKNYGKSCPICEKSAEYYNDGNKDAGKDLLPSRRVFFNVQPLVKGEYQDIQVFEVSHYLFMKDLITEAHECSDGKEIIEFANIENGKIIKFRADEEPWGKNKVLKYKSFNFLERDEELDDDIIDEAISFDAGLTLLSYENIERAFYGQDEDEDEEPEKKKDKKESKQDDDEEEEDDPEPPKKEKKEDKKPEKDEDEEPEKKKEDKKAESGKCPSGFKWGEADNHKECKKCELWDECIDA